MKGLDLELSWFSVCVHLISVNKSVLLRSLCAQGFIIRITPHVNVGAAGEVKVFNGE